MKPFDVSKIAWASAIALGLATLPLSVPASAQTGTGPDGTTTAPGDTTPGTTTAPGRTTPGTTAAPNNRTVDQQVSPARGDRGTNWSWLGLSGLIGLAGLTNLFRKHPEDPVRYR